MMKQRIYSAVLLYLSFSHSMTSADTYVRDDINTRPDPSEFSVCHGHGCTEVSHISLSKSQWQRIQDIFNPLANDADDERKRIAEAIAVLETMVGRITGTGIDKAGTLDNVDSLYLDTQMDCIDESTNTSIYITMMHKDNLLKWHTVEDRVTRGFFIFGAPHTTAVIRDAASNKLYAVDSWFEDNGKPPHIVSLDIWEDGWEPR